MSYTAGPWDIDCRKPDVHNGGSCVTAIGPLQPDHCHWCGPNLGVTVDDAHLIAAAPELLAEHKKDLYAIKTLNTELIRCGLPRTNPARLALTDMLRAKRVVIAKARGKP